MGLISRVSSRTYRNQMRLLYLSSLVVLADIHFPRGVNPRNQHLYNPVSGQNFKCIKSGELVPITSLNDDYCDCVDGSDEPGTSACAHLSKKPNTFVGFWCRNAGFKEQTISPMIVDDGICDCCDGSDESFKKCENTCDQVGAIERERAAAEKALFAEGIAIKKEWMVEGKKAHAERESEIKEIEAEMAEMEKKAEELKAKRDQVCEIEKVEKQRCLDADKAKKEAEAAEKKKNAIVNGYRQLDLNGDGVLTAEELVTFDELRPEVNETFSLDQAKVLLDGESSNPESFASVTWDLISEHFDEDGWLPGNEPTEPPTEAPTERSVDENSEGESQQKNDEEDSVNIPDPEDDFAEEFDNDFDDDEDDDFDDDEDEDDDEDDDNTDDLPSDRTWKDDDRNYDDYDDDYD